VADTEETSDLHASLRVLIAIAQIIVDRSRAIVTQFSALASAIAEDLLCVIADGL
jgi:hypothetical protein